MMLLKEDAISLLKADHKKVRALLEELEATSDRAAKKRETLFTKIERELEAQTDIEETIFYPAYRDAVKKKEDRQMYFEALEEHHVVKLVLPELGRTQPGSVEFAAKAKVLKELVTHHAKEEERDMFSEAKKVMSKDELVALGEKMKARKEQLLAKAG